MTPPVLTIAGSDSGGGAGIQADLKTFFAHGAFGMSAITAITAQNTKAVLQVEVLTEQIIQQQIYAVVSDIGVAAAKTGMLATAGITCCVANTLRELKIPNLVVDPVMISKSGHRLLAEDAITTLIKELLPLATVATPNLFEAELILGKKIRDVATMKEAAKALFDIGVRYPLIKGGHLENLPAIDILFDGTDFIEFSAPRLNSTNTHGTGCTYSAAIAARLAHGESPPQAIAAAKQYISGAIATAFPLGLGHGPVNHFFGTKVNI